MLGELSTVAPDAPVPCALHANGRGQPDASSHLRRNVTFQVRGRLREALLFQESTAVRSTHHSAHIFLRCREDELWLVQFGVT